MSESELLQSDTHLEKTTSLYLTTAIRLARWRKSELNHCVDRICSCQSFLQRDGIPRIIDDIPRRLPRLDFPALGDNIRAGVEGFFLAAENNQVRFGKLVINGHSASHLPPSNAKIFSGISKHHNCNPVRPWHMTWLHLITFLSACHHMWNGCSLSLQWEASSKFCRSCSPGGSSSWQQSLLQ